MKGKLITTLKPSKSVRRRINVWKRNRNKNAYSGMLTVKLKVVFSRLLDIDTLSQQFEAEIYVQARWTEPQFAGMTEQELNVVDFERCTDPKLSILNKASEFDSEKKSMMIQYEQDEMDPVVTFMWRVRGMFRENLELSHFPFDVQEMSIVLSSERTASEIDLRPDQDHLSNVSPGALTEGHEWTMFRHVEFTKDFTTTEFITFTKHPVLLASCHAQRRIGFYMWNIVIIVVVILGLTLTVLSIDPSGVDRLMVTITLFLTAVAFKLVVKTTLPTISYLTYLDVYMIFTLMYLAIQAWENAIMSHLARYREREKVVAYDEVAQSILIALLILFHAVFIVYIQLTAFRRRRSMYEKDHEFHMIKMKQKMKRRQAAYKDYPSVDNLQERGGFGPNQPMRNPNQQNRGDMPQSNRFPNSQYNPQQQQQQPNQFPNSPYNPQQQQQQQQQPNQFPNSQYNAPLQMDQNPPSQFNTPRHSDQYLNSNMDNNNMAPNADLNKTYNKRKELSVSFSGPATTSGESSTNDHSDSSSIDYMQ